MALNLSYLVSGPAQRGDLINFYNQVYVQCMQTFALRFTGRNRDVSITLPETVISTYRRYNFAKPK